MQLKKYKKDFEFSYALGPFPSFELINTLPETVLEVHASESFNDLEKLETLCKEKNIPIIIGEKQLNKISTKEKCYAAAVFKKFNGNLDFDKKAHVVLQNPSDMGNLGTIIRSMLGFGIKNLAIISPCADVFDPKVVRSSMGAIFKMNIAMFESFEDYLLSCSKKRDIYPFMLTGSNDLRLDNCPKSDCYSLVFGNEAKGLPKDFEKYETIFIPQTKDVDSLNLAISVALGSFVFSSVNGI
ncbi:MAG: TrmH family RNA methyltransferase [Clostridia bacterium]